MTQAPVLDVEQIRTDFPTLNVQVNGKPLVYLDNGATSHKPKPVIEVMNRFYTEGNANVHRGIHTLSQQATDAYEEARRLAQRFLNAPHEEEIIFTSGTTMACNLVAFSFGERFVQAGDEILISTMEHHANIVPWQMMAARKGAKLRVIPMNDTGILDLETYQKMLNPRVKLVSVIHVSNMLGTVNPVAEMIAMAHAQGIPVMVDGAQSAAHMPVDVQALDADFFTFSAHKIFGPTGVGILYGKRAFLDEMPPFFGGGDMIRRVTFEETTYNVLPHKFEAGTPNISGVIGMGEALRYAMDLGMEHMHAYEQQLFTYAYDALRTVEGLRIFGNAPGKAPIFSFHLGQIHPFDLGMVLDKQGIAIRTGHHCTEPLHQRLGITGSARASFSVYNTVEEVDRLVAGLHKARKLLG